jgi:hypothetical protein
MSTASAIVEAHEQEIAKKLLIDLIGQKACSATSAENASLWARMHETEDFGFSGKYGLIRDILEFPLIAGGHPYET